MRDSGQSPGRWRQAWAGLPIPARWVLAVYLIGFGDGTAAHIRDLARGGLAAYSALPLWVQLFFIALTGVDPLILVLLALACRPAIGLAAGVMAADVAVNLTGNWPSIQAHPNRLLAPGGLLPIMLFGAFVLLTAVPVRRAIASHKHRARCGPARSAG